MEIKVKINDLDAFVEDLNECDSKVILYNIFEHLSAEQLQDTLLTYVGYPRLKDILGWDEDKILDCIDEKYIISYLELKGYDVKESFKK